MRNYESDAYRKYRSSMEQRQKVVRTSGSPYSQQTAVQGKRQIAERSASTKRKRTREKGKPYYDYDLLLVIIFLMCFGLVMLYSSSATVHRMIIIMICFSLQDRRLSVLSDFLQCLSFLRLTIICMVRMQKNFFGFQCF